MKTYLQTCLAISILSIFATPVLGMEKSSEANATLSSFPSKEVISFNSTSGLNSVASDSLKSEGEHMIDLLSKTNDLSLESNVTSRSDLNTRREISGDNAASITLIQF
ncbi:MAG: hypothetical protein AAF298_23380 [Cyanobacteria bacterium P01_A01_bin.40]